MTRWLALHLFLGLLFCAAPGRDALAALDVQTGKQLFRNYEVHDPDAGLAYSMQYYDSFAETLYIEFSGPSGFRMLSINLRNGEAAWLPPDTEPENSTTRYDRSYLPVPPYGLNMLLDTNVFRIRQVDNMKQPFGDHAITFLQDESYIVLNLKGGGMLEVGNGTLKIRVEDARNNVVFEAHEKYQHNIQARPAFWTHDGRYIVIFEKTSRGVHIETVGPFDIQREKDDIDSMTQWSSAIRDEGNDIIRFSRGVTGPDQLISSYKLTKRALEKCQNLRSALGDLRIPDITSPSDILRHSADEDKGYIFNFSFSSDTGKTGTISAYSTPFNVRGDGQAKYIRLEDTALVKEDGGEHFYTRCDI